MTIDAAYAEGQKLATSAVIELFELDLSYIGITTPLRFTPNVDSLQSDGSVYFGGVEFIPIDMETEGFEFDGTSAFPQPTIRFSNVFRFISGLLYSYSDLVGCQITRTKTFAIFLDGHEEEDSSTSFVPDIYTIFQKTKHTDSVIEFKLAAAADQQGEDLPKGTIQRDTCPFAYRVYDSDTGDFDYTNVECPYTDDSYFDADGNTVTDAASDQCGYRKSDCALRFSDSLPFGGFPGVTNVQT